MNENENLVPNEGAEKVEQTTEQTQQPAKTYTDDEVNAIVGKKKSILEAKIRKEYDRKYEKQNELVSVIKAGMGKEDEGEIAEDLRKFYGNKGVKIEKKPEYSAQDIETLARADANEIIRMGDDEAVEEFERLEALGTKMTKRDQATFKLLAEHLQNAQASRELSSIGVTEDVYNSAEFKEFKSQFNSNVPITKVYDLYSKTLPKKEIKNPGSMKSTTVADDGVKDFYSYEESLKFTKKDFDKNPALYKAVCDSMAKW